MAVQMPPPKGPIAQRKEQLEQRLVTLRGVKTTTKGWGKLAAHADPLYHQIGALCWQPTPAGPQVLLVSATSGRWIIPKGWALPGKSPIDAALAEAWEEAGVKKAKAQPRSIGHYMGTKRTLGGDEVLGAVQVYALRVRKLLDDYPEADRRQRQWFSAAEAAALVDEDGLRDLLIAFAAT
ncbi:NUDIX hydrolase [Ketogulonicigenium vulgare]|uniref:Hydrolase, NUDIX family protein n=1 Tax=Ketogulonicigenium vulgare (strain WSH-001) TaxID=759362 RepID=F9Y3F2_KETVW|nr:NUDIX domain-containing protein [Ketogulonicigenium vulgare]ADO43284.1 hydrolase, NUDIX family protein [Ketogulonicigenium vulgare Y25]AEM41572.1 Hydrolase, NUDIX family protein [Ketogulonicigenium vulgare WSH-001]ALJ81691.1 NUDIX hydrolase [Ketogulonicigenium vulgare]ANW34362.1 NUDIX hydrolase [Ketogulonicigenium vulgare]AOZ55321.1 hydrolase, NUDIX family protein [Ketogulonicigenium vulgare]